MVRHNGAVYNKPSMPEFAIRPTLKLVKAGYAAVALSIAAAFVMYYRLGSAYPLWLPALSVLLVLWPLSRQGRRSFTRCIVEADKLRYQTGFLSRTTRTVPLSKIQDVRVAQTVGQRLLGIGTISIETAGETGLLSIADVDQPQEAADRIMAASEKGMSRGA
jgi:uncharacterized membrane protein YdbT with pleckstrin-like domain